MAALFQYEYQMSKPAEKWLYSQSELIKKEFQTPWGICDFVGCSLHKLRVKQRQKLNQKNAIGSQKRIMILSLIPDEEEDKYISTHNLFLKFKGMLDKASIEKELEILENGKFVKKITKQSYQKINGWYPLHKKIIAIELKLNKIHDALNQAINNLGFADESYVGLPIALASKLQKNNKISIFKESGIGILGISKLGGKVILKPSSQKIHIDKVLQQHCVERFWRSRIINN